MTQAATSRRRVNPKTKLDLILDRVEKGVREVTIDVRDFTKEQVDRVIRTAEGRGLHVSSDGKHVLVRKLNPTSNPKSPSLMSAGEINKALDAIDAQVSKLTQEFIDAGRGHERPSEYLKMNDPLANRAKDLYNKRSALQIEKDMRYGPGAPSRLPKGRGFGPRMKNPVDPQMTDLAYRMGKEWGTKDRGLLRRDRNSFLRLFSNSLLEELRTRGLIKGRLAAEDRESLLAAFQDGYRATYEAGRQRNPEGSSEEMYQSFHGTPSTETLEYEQEVHYHGNLAALGELVELKVTLLSGDKAVLTFDAAEGEQAKNPQKWLLPKKSHKKNYEDVGYLPYALEHDIGFSGSKMYRPVKYENGTITVMSMDLAREEYDRYSRKSAIDAIKRLAGATRNPTTTYPKVYPTLAAAKRAWYDSAPGRNDKGTFRKVKGGYQIHEGKDNPFWPFSSHSRSVIYHVGTGDEYKLSGTHKGYKIYKEPTGGFAVPKLDAESRFDTKKDAEKFIDSWKKVRPNPGREYRYPDEARLMNSIAEGEMRLRSKRDSLGKKVSQAQLDAIQRSVDNSKRRLAEMQAENDAKYGRTNPKHKHGPFHEAGKLFSQSSGAITKPFDQFTDVVGKVGGYVDDQIGRVVNPTDNLWELIGERSGAEKASFSIHHEMPSIEYIKGTASDVLRKESPEAWEGIRSTSEKKEAISGFVKGFKRGFKAAKKTKRNPEVPSSDSVLLTVNEKGTQLYLTGGDQSIDLSSLKITGPAADKEHIVLGDVTHIVYRTQKDFDKFQPTDYIHEFSEDSGGPPPELVYDRINERLSLVGGVYFIKQPMLKTSPGIED
jgi:hypothetical protein